MPIMTTSVMNNGTRLLTGTRDGSLTHVIVINQEMQTKECTPLRQRMRWCKIKSQSATKECGLENRRILLGKERDHGEIIAVSLGKRGFVSRKSSCIGSVALLVGGTNFTKGLGGPFASLDKVGNFAWQSLCVAA